jgi:hypothetical protein
MKGINMKNRALIALTIGVAFTENSLAIRERNCNLLKGLTSRADIEARDKTKSISELQEEKRILRITIEQQQSTIDQQREQIGKLNADLVGNQAKIDQLQAEIVELRNQLNVNTRHAWDLGLTIPEYNKYIEFRDRVIDLLTRAQTGHDYRLLKAISGKGLHKDLQYAQQEYTIAGIASNNIKRYSSGSITLKDWQEASRLVNQCIGLLKGICVSVSKTDMPKIMYEIECLIRTVRQLLPIRKATIRGKGKSYGHLDEEPRVLVGRSIDKALETFQIFRQMTMAETDSPIPEDPYEIAVGDEVFAARFDEVSGKIISEGSQKLLSIRDPEDERFKPETLLAPGLLGQ